MGGLLIGFASIELGVVTLGFNTDVVCLFCGMCLVFGPPLLDF